jgi:hypothetical protein
MSKMNDDERFKHVDYRHTDLRKTFARIRAKQKEEAAAKVDREAAAVELLYAVYPSLKVRRIK